MQKVNENHIFTGMQRDLSISKHPIQFLYDAKNIRLTAREGDTLMSITNEQGTKKCVIGEEENETEIVINGVYLGHCLLNQYLIIFSTCQEEIENEGNVTTVQKDYITRIDLSFESVTPVTILYGEGGNQDSLGFSEEHPIEAIGSYETEAIQKVYWTDGHNQPRVINIAPDKDNKIAGYNSKSFDFVQELALNEAVTVKKMVDASGEFAPGVIQYAFTYYNKYGQESNIFHTTPLYYISHFDRGGKPDEKISNAFSIRVSGVDKKFDYLRIYSIHRSSINVTPFVKRIQDIDLTVLEDNENSVSFVDDGISGDTVDPTELLYKGGEEITAGTIEQKDGTLFLGDIQIKRESLSIIQDEFDDIPDEGNKSKNRWFTEAYRTIYPTLVSSGGYTYYNQLTSYVDKDKTRSVPCGGFKRGEHYRCGIQFQHKTGKWSEPIYITDVKVTGNVSDVSYPKEDDNKIELPCIKANIASDYLKTAYSKGYRKVRPVIVFPELQDKNIICQGVVNPTMLASSSGTSSTASAPPGPGTGEEVLNPNDGSDSGNGSSGNSGSGNNGSGSTGDNTSESTNPLHVQSSWFFRPPMDNYVNGDKVTIAPISLENGNNDCYLPYCYRQIQPDKPLPDTATFDPTGSTIRRVEIQGDFKNENKFKVYSGMWTLHSPDVEFDDSVAVMDLHTCKCQEVSSVEFKNTFSDIDIQTESPTISGLGSGFVHKSFNKQGPYGIIAGLFYEDLVVDDFEDDNTIVALRKSFKQSPKWMVYPWHGTGSLNNDINRPADKGTPSAKLKKKVISNLRYTSTEAFKNTAVSKKISDLQMFSSNEISILKLNEGIYQGNVDTLLMPDYSDGLYFASNLGDYNIHGTPDGYTAIDGDINYLDEETPFDCNDSCWFKTWSNDPTLGSQYGMRWFNKKPVKGTEKPNWAWAGGGFGETYVDLVMKKNAVRMKYKSTPHLVLKSTTISLETQKLPIFEVTQSVISRFGGTSKDALMANIWIPCGESKRIIIETIGNTDTYKLKDVYTETSSNDIEYSYGDTYFQRYDCLKTYAFTREDINQIVEIGSFMLETHVNIDGRYDRNRGQMNNLNMSPQNFNLINPIYSQRDNFFSYKIQDEDFYNDVKYPNQVTWTKEKNAGAEIDMWTNITLASTYDMDGSKGRVEELVTYKDQIFCFQNKGISNILFNSRVQIPTSDNVPIEISNSYKVDGHRYIGDGIGCKDKRLVKKTPMGIYFIDSVGSHLFHISEQGLTDLAERCNMTSWFRKAADSEHPIKKVLYDDINHDVYSVIDDQSLCFSEKLNQFTGFYDYDDINLIETYDHKVFTLRHDKENEEDEEKLWNMFQGDYCRFFGANKPWSFTFVSNGLNDGLVNKDKVFTNLEFRASVEGDGIEETQEVEDPETHEMVTVKTGKFLPTLPLDSLETWNEYQHGEASLDNLSGHAAMMHHLKNDPTASLKRKFRIWRCDVPRDNCTVTEEEEELGIFRKAKHPNDRMRNPWLYIKLQKNAAEDTEDEETEEVVENSLNKTEIHDMVMTYYI